MRSTLPLVVVLLFGFIAVTLSQSEDDLYILLDEINVFSCRGVKNEVRMSDNDVQVVNEKGNRVHYIKAPGNYSIHFSRIQVLQNFGYLTGEIGVTLQVPILEGPAGIRFDVPYTMIPETGLLNQQCDEHSGIVERDKRSYCRYCELCQISNKVEAGLNTGRHKFLPELAHGQEEAFAPHCGEIGRNVYEFKRSLNLPGRKELENMIKGKVQGIDDEVKKRLNKGRGRFQVYLNLISAEQPPIGQQAWFQGSEQCRSCTPGARPQQRGGGFGFLYCNAEDCKSAWAQQCLHNSAKIVACYTVEFNYRMTSNYNDVVRFLRENNYPNQEVATAPPPTPPPPPPPPPPPAPAGQTGAEALQELSARCVAQIPVKSSHLRRYCTIFWNEKLCCTNCPGVC